ncbi:Ig-like domain-containing protein [Pseudoalteromonas sp. SSDWG2]|uniref:Ig-like domain-containing protein n=1 Tax=Pseudoalteromonas sp. SSDWG2 TaxID=3139391 RepID=UPI003BACA45C
MHFRYECFPSLDAHFLTYSHQLNAALTFYFGLTPVNPNNTLTLTPAAQFNDEATINYTLADEFAATAHAQVYVNLIPNKSDAIDTQSSSVHWWFVLFLILVRWRRHTKDLG